MREGGRKGEKEGGLTHIGVNTCLLLDVMVTRICPNHITEM